MPLFDKIKAQAAQVGKMAQDASKAGQAKLDQVQSKRQLDALYRDLGSAVYAERNGDSAAGAEVTRLIGEITDHITANPAPEDEASPVVPGSGEPPTGGAPTATYGS